MERVKWMSLGGVGHVEIIEGFFGLTIDTLLDDEVDEIKVEAEQQLMQCLHLDID